MRISERIAKLIIEACVQGSTMEYCPEQSHGECDFILHLANGDQALVEVTESVDQNQRLIYDKILSTKEGGPVVEAKKCRKSWIIVPTKNAQIAKIRARADDYLSTLEKGDIETFNRWFPTTQTVERICNDLFLVNGSAICTEGPPKIHILLPGGDGGWVSPVVAIAAAEKEASKIDNRQKLGFAKTQQRHLAVYVDVTNGAWAVLKACKPPSTLPKLPAEITHIWLISYSGASKDEFVVWRASTQERWYGQRVVIPQDERKAS